MNIQAQSYSADKGWMVGVNGGFVSFFGDLSIHDNDILLKLKNESDVGFSLMAGKQFSPSISVNINYLKGRMQGINPGLKSFFISSFNEISLSTELNMISLLSPSSETHFRAICMIGVGLLNSSVTNTSQNLMLPDAGQPNLQYVSAVSLEPVLVSGIGIDYSLSTHLRSTLRLSIHNTRNDKLDGYEGTATTANDHYTFVTVGLVYSITPGRNSFVQAYPCSPW